ncbi:MAG: acyltransferase [Chitinophagaceae bacterium]|nr:acyltransferase [Chitinophagaceae bacterium]
MSQPAPINSIIKDNTVQNSMVKVQLKGLNGIRTIAAMAVVIFHIGVELKAFGFESTTRTDLGGFGVSMFFSLSGFLITYLLLIEKARFGNVSIKDFYIRRVLRIWPLYFLYLTLALITMYVYLPESLPGSLAYYLFLGANIPYIFGTTLPLLIHYWSLGVEEQFYLFWPWVIRKSKNILRFLIIFTVVFIVIKLGLRYINATTEYKWPYQAWHVTRFDCMTIGAIGAFFFYHKNPLFLKVVYSVPAQILAWSVVVLMLFNKFHIASVLDSEFLAALTVVMIVNVSTNPKTLVNLDKPVFDFLGKISYGIYVYHAIIIFFTIEWLGFFIQRLPIVPRYMFVFTFIPLVTFLVSYLSYEYFEKRFLRIKSQHARVKSSDTKTWIETQPLNPDPVVLPDTAKVRASQVD